MGVLHVPVLQLPRFPLQAVLSLIATQAPADDEQVLQTPQAAPLLFQVPVLSHSCGWVPLQVFAPGEQEPVQVAVAAVQTNWQAVPLFCHAPFESQSCGCNPLHCFAPGVHTPVHVPVAAAQTNEQAEPLLCQAPVASHFCGCRPLHLTAPGVQVPLQTPAPLQT
jgi:hypothetical protein